MCAEIAVERLWCDGMVHEIRGDTYVHEIMGDRYARSDRDSHFFAELSTLQFFKNTSLSDVTVRTRPNFK